MKTLFWAFVERFAPRAGTALLMLAFAALSTPATVGYYAAMMTGYAVLQAVTDGAAKRTATTAVATEQGLLFLRRYRRWYAALGTLFLLGVMWVVTLWGAAVSDVVTFLPLLLLPTIMGRTVVPLALLQRAGQWKRISMLSSASALAALCVGFPLVFAFHNALGSVVQLVLTELLFAVGVHWASRTLRESCLVTSDPSARYWPHFASAGTFIISLQGQYQLDRVTVGAMAGPAALGSFNLGWALARTFTDSLSTSTLNVVQARVIDGQKKSADAIRTIVMAALPRALIMASVIVVGVYVAARFVAPLFLGEEWNDMLQVVPLMSVTGIPSICCYCLLPPLLYFKRINWATAPRLLGLVLSLAIGWAVQYSLDAAVWIALFREFLALAVMLVGAKVIVTKRMVLLPIGATAAACLLISAADGLLFHLGLLAG